MYGPWNDARKRPAPWLTNLFWLISLPPRKKHCSLSRSKVAAAPPARVASNAVSGGDGVQGGYSVGLPALPHSQHNSSLLPRSPALSEQPVVDTATATEQAKQLVKSGAISAIKAETKNSGFKRSRTLEGKLKVSTGRWFAHL